MMVVKSCLSVVLMLGLLAGSLSGCVVQRQVRQGYYNVKHKVQGAYYLEGERYEEGVRVFERALAENPESAEVHYYLGRCQMETGRATPALAHLKRSVALDPTEADYHYWLGVAFHENGEIASERTCYQRAVERDPNHVLALACLGHVHLEQGDLQEALAAYQRVLRLQPESPSVLYNRALILGRLGRTPEEALAWKAYLGRYPAGTLAVRATTHLNELGDFEYRNHVIGKRTVCLRKIWFEVSSDTLWEGSLPSLDRLGGLLQSGKPYVLHIVAYQKRNKPLAEARAKRIKQYLVSRFPGLEPDRLRVSWFGVPERIRVGTSEFQEEASIQFFTAPAGTRAEGKTGPEANGRGPS
jgi:cytochrome c-type biogenesis protein CcmH/NrfG